MSETLAILYLIGTVVTLVAFVVFFAKRYPRQSGWLAIGVAIGMAMMFLWPVTMWIAIAMGLTGFARPRTPRPRTPGTPSYRKPPLMFPKKVVIPLCVAGALITIGIIRATTDPVVEPGSAVAATPGATPAPSVGNAPPPTIDVVDVVDGDTIKLNDGRTVRIIGIDTPETVAPGKPVECGGPEATAFARQELLDRPVTLIEDPTQNLVDHYGRTLTYVVLPDGRDYSVLAAEAGHARAYLGTVPAQRYDAISAAESRARAAGLGLWGPACVSPSPQPEPVTAPEPAAEPDSGPSVYYRNCAEARAAGSAPLHAGEPGYRSGLDGDEDGVACDS